jgi:hypothetical protein
MGKLTKGATIALHALYEAIGECGEIPPASNHIPAGVKCVKVNLWRRYVYLKGISPDGEDRAKRQAFRRATEALLAARQVSIWDEYVWPLR